MLGTNAHDHVALGVALVGQLLAAALQRDAAGLHMALQELDLAHKIRNEGSGGLIVDHLGRANLLDDALVDDHDAVAHGHGLGLVVGDVDHRNAVLLLNVLDLKAHALAQLCVQIGQGLVQKEQVGMAQEELGQRDAHLPAARELGARALKVGDLKAQAGQDLARVALELVAAQVLKAVLDLAVLVEEGVDVFALLGELGDLGLQLVGALAHAADFLGGGHDLGEDGGVLLLQVGFLL